ncbi:hypothetical protein B0O99DRAFT_687438 [Bisporella sp. PMI_857]|nr:hypothetical protein B0O99DRAFT_687438 [Bisporella sp. PMI_857]
MTSLNDLITAIHRTPIVDNHAHPLLAPSAQTKHNLLAITTEAHGNAISSTKSSLPHIRGVKQLASILGCGEDWDEVVRAIQREKAKPDDAWAKRCFEGIEMLLIDDGLDGKDDVLDYSWHDRLTRTPSKRIVRIEKVAEEIIDRYLKQHGELSAEQKAEGILREFEDVIKSAVVDPEVVGFKSVICYRTGLRLTLPSGSVVRAEFVELLTKLNSEGKTDFTRLDGLHFNTWIVHHTASIIEKSSSRVKKPLQFHTGLGDNDITLTRSSPSHLQSFIRKFPEVPIVLLHASYPWTKEAGYLASVYENCYADIGEVFPFISKEGQEKVVREVLELCPTEKILWSTDGHWFPETFLLAVMQVREALEVVLSDYVIKDVLNVSQAIRVVEDLFFNTSNKLYGLGLSLKPLPERAHSPSMTSDLATLTSFLVTYPDTKFLRLQYLDYTATPRLRVIPTKKALSVLRGQALHQNGQLPKLDIGITKASLGLLQNDTIIPGVTASGEYRLKAIFSSLRPGPNEHFASVQGEFYEQDGQEVALCPRSSLRRAVERAKASNLDFLVGFEIEIVFLSRNPCEEQHNGPKYKPLTTSSSHAWNSARALDNNYRVLTEIYDTLARAGIELEQWHPEGANGQYEFVLPPLPPLEAVDTLLHAREIISNVVASHGLRATLIPKPSPIEIGTASHLHISVSSVDKSKTISYESFYAGILSSLPGIIAFTYSKPASYERVVDGCWAGGRWVTWGTQNRETPLRKIEGSHWEIKCLDGLANMYLALAAVISAGTYGHNAGQVLYWLDCKGDPASLASQERKNLGITEALPSDLNQALESLKRNQVLCKALGRDVVDRYCTVKKAEMKLLEGMDEEKRREWVIDRY